MSGSTIAAGFARGLSDLAVSKGADRRALMARSGLDAALLEDPDRRLPFSAYMALMRAAKDLSGDPALALHFGEGADLAELSVLGHLGNATGTMADGLARVNRFASLAVEFEGLTGDRLRLQSIEGQLWMIDRRPDPNAFPEFTESFFARLVCDSRKRFGGRAFAEEVHVTHAEPAYRAEYDRIFQVPVRFGCDLNALRLAGGAMDLKTPPAPSYAAGVLEAHAEALLEKLEGARTLRGRVEQALLPRLPVGEAGVEAVARELGFSRQTLYRRLRAEGTTFDQVLDELRYRTALHHLIDQGASVNETAYRLGFSDPAAFSRAFKRWTGKSPREARTGHTPKAPDR